MFPLEGYLSEEFNPASEFWDAFNISNRCHVCKFNMNGNTSILDVYNKKYVRIQCKLCGAEWDIVLDDHGKEKIESLIKAEKEFYKLRAQLVNCVRFLHGVDKKWKKH